MYTDIVNVDGNVLYISILLLLFINIVTLVIILKKSLERRQAARGFEFEEQDMLEAHFEQDKENELYKVDRLLKDMESREKRTKEEDGLKTTEFSRNENTPKNKNTSRQSLEQSEDHIIPSLLGEPINELIIESPIKTGSSNTLIHNKQKHTDTNTKATREAEQDVREIVAQKLRKLNRDTHENKEENDGLSHVDAKIEPAFKESPKQLDQVNITKEPDIRQIVAQKFKKLNAANTKHKNKQKNEQENPKKLERSGEQIIPLENEPENKTKNKNELHQTNKAEQDSLEQNDKQLENKQIEKETSKKNAITQQTQNSMKTQNLMTESIENDVPQKETVKAAFKGLAANEAKEKTNAKKSFDFGKQKTKKETANKNDLNETLDNASKTTDSTINITKPPIVSRKVDKEKLLKGFSGDRRALKTEKRSAFLNRLKKDVDFIETIENNSGDAYISSQEYEQTKISENEQKIDKKQNKTNKTKKLSLFRKSGNDKNAAENADGTMPEMMRDTIKRVVIKEKEKTEKEKTKETIGLLSLFKRKETDKDNMEQLSETKEKTKKKEKNNKEQKGNKDKNDIKKKELAKSKKRKRKKEQVYIEDSVILNDDFYDLVKTNEKKYIKEPDADFEPDEAYQTNKNKKQRKQRTKSFIGHSNKTSEVFSVEQAQPKRKRLEMARKNRTKSEAKNEDENIKQHTNPTLDLLKEKLKEKALEAAEKERKENGKIVQEGKTVREEAVNEIEKKQQKKDETKDKPKSEIKEDLRERLRKIAELKNKQANEGDINADEINEANKKDKMRNKKTPAIFFDSDSPKEKIEEKTKGESSLSMFERIELIKKQNRQKQKAIVNVENNDEGNKEISKTEQKTEEIRPENEEEKEERSVKERKTTKDVYELLKKYKKNFETQTK